MQQVSMGALKSRIIPVGTVITFKDVLKGEMKQNGREVPNDVIVGAIEGKKDVRIPVREYFKMAVKEGSHFLSEDDMDEIKFPNGIKILESKDRKSQDGGDIWPVFAYKLHNDFTSGAIDWKALVAGGLIDEVETRFDKVQDYTIEIL